MANPFANKAWNEYQGALGAYNQAQESRYNQILAGYGQQLLGYSQQGGKIAKGWRDLQARMLGLGDGQRLQQGYQFDQLGARQQQSMVSRGMWNSTVADAANRGVQGQRALADITLGDTLRREQAGYKLGELEWRDRYAGNYANLEGGRLGFMERRQDAPPDFGAYAWRAGMDSQWQSEQWNRANQLAQQGAAIPSGAAGGTGGRMGMPSIGNPTGAMLSSSMAPPSAYQPLQSQSYGYTPSGNGYSQSVYPAAATVGQIAGSIGSMGGFGMLGALGNAYGYGTGGPGNGAGGYGGWLGGMANAAGPASSYGAPAVDHSYGSPTTGYAGLLGALAGTPYGALGGISDYYGYGE